MPIVDLIFDWGNTIILYFSKAADWFCSPNQVFDEAVGVLVELPVFGHRFDRELCGQKNACPKACAGGGKGFRRFRGRVE